MLSSAHAQVFLYRFGNWQHRYFRVEALICRDGATSGQLHSIPANYVLDLLTAACAGWEDLIECSRGFLSRMVRTPDQLVAPTKQLTECSRPETRDTRRVDSE